MKTTQLGSGNDNSAQAQTDQIGRRNQSDTVPEGIHREIDAEHQTSFSVFVSYRVDPDQPLAEALKEIIETSIEPRPKVFVSGVGGLRPSALTFPTQLQSAARQCKAFIGLISNASKDRAWIQFEAGAAWGRGCMYAPLLVDVAPSDLENTISLYQATRATEADSMAELIENLAGTLGAKARGRFSRRYQSFNRALTQYKTGSSQNAEGRESALERGPADEVEAAGLLLLEGKKEEGRSLLRQLANAGDATRASHARIVSVAYEVDKPAAERLLALEQLSPEDRKHPVYTFWHGYLETDPSVALTELREYLRAPISAVDRQLALHETLKLEHDLGNAEKALAIIADELAADDRLHREMAASIYADIWKNANPLSILSAVVIGVTANATATLLKAAAEIASAQNWHALAVYFADRFDSLAKDGASANQYGIALQGASFASLAYEKFRKASSLGVSVSKANIANLFLHGPVAAAGLALMQEHQGAFDAAIPGYPHEVRSQLEEAVTTQTKEAEELRAKGRRLFIKLSKVITEGMSTPNRDFRFEGRFRAKGQEFLVEPHGPTEWLVRDSRSVNATFLSGQTGRVCRQLFPNRALSGIRSDKSFALLIPEEGGFRSLESNGADDGEWVFWNHQP